MANSILDLIKQQVDGNVKFLFKHALAKLQFNVQAIVDDDDDATKEVAANNKIFVRKDAQCWKILQIFPHFLREM